mgnify:CR=1
MYNLGEETIMAVPNMWRTKKQRYSLQGEVCPACTSAIFPPRKVCPQCGTPMDAARRGHHLAAGSAIFSGMADVAMNPAGDD